ncbi:DoxX family protein [Lactococcus termiticola]|uniref:DoxX family protein n=1 Tax=Lactococcus termiticola TaxID=2169526 RepID=A0A2R5HGW8_9LACT|nr:DoxX family protein [Lactococcus termiticola]GBG97307.1 hypothetical protein NtB2_01446 [Lactococcus termiticola]
MEKMSQNIWSERILPIIVVIGRMLLGAEWIHQAILKLQPGSGFSLDGLGPSVAMTAGIPEWYKAFFEGFVVPNTQLFNVIIPWGELLIGLGLFFGVLSLPALIASFFMLGNYWWSDMVYIYPILMLAGIAILFFNKFDKFRGSRLLKFVNKNWGDWTQSRWL